MTDTEIRGFLDGTVKFERNVATQYHVRIGCEASKPVGGRYEVMRVLQRWDLSPLPRCARVTTARLVLRQEDITAFPHRNPLLWPTDFCLFETRKPWGPGRGGAKEDNQSAPEPGDAWWREARAGELPWKVPGCGFGSDDDPADRGADRCADRGAEPLAWARIESPRDDLVFSGPRLAAHVERLATEGRTLDILIKAGDACEARTGSIKAFYSGEFGDDLNPSRRPRLEVEWQAPSAWSLVRPFVLEPGRRTSVRCDLPSDVPTGAVLHASVTVDEASPFAPEVHIPACPAVPPGTTGIACPQEVEVSAAIHPVRAGERISISILETWAPGVKRPEDLEVAFHFTAPSGRTLAERARHAGGFRYTAEVRPDEMGVWTCSWRTRPDPRFPEQSGSGHFTVVRGADEAAQAAALCSFAEAALRDAREERGIRARRRNHFRLTVLETELKKLGGHTDVLAEIAKALPFVE